MANYRPTRDEIATIRTFAGRTAQRSRFKIEIGSRVNLNDGKIPASINIHAITHDASGNWNDTDLHDMHDWSTIRKIPMTNDARALVDCYVYEWSWTDGCWGDLVCNVQAEFDQAGLMAIHADSTKNVWRRAE